MIHPARTRPFDTLYTALQYVVAEGLVHEQIGENGLRLYCYSDETVYSRQWNPITLMARGLILDVEKKEVVATPFPKFFNVGEVGSAIPDLPFETFDKLDGSLVIIFYHAGSWHCATKGSFKSDQAKWAKRWMDNRKGFPKLKEGMTYLAEAIYPSNRIVVDYCGAEELRLLAAYNADGSEIEYKALNFMCAYSSLGIVERHSYSSISELMEKAKTLDCNSEGWVIRFSDGTRLKIKGDEYCRIHRLISGLTPLAIWRSMRDEEDLEIMRRQLPEEFWGDYDTIVNLLYSQQRALMASIEAHYQPFAQLSDKEIGLRLEEFPEEVRRFIFPLRNGRLVPGDRAMLGLFEAIRPTRNNLPGYRASSSVARVLEAMEE